MVPSLSYTPNYHSAANYRTGSGSDRTQLSTAHRIEGAITEPGATALNKQVARHKTSLYLLTTSTKDDPGADLESQRHTFRS